MKRDRFFNNSTEKESPKRPVHVKVARLVSAVVELPEPP